MEVHQYAFLTKSLQIAYPALHDLHQMLPFMGIRQRKAVVSVTRVQRRPVMGTRAYQRLHRDLNVHVRRMDGGLTHLVRYCQSLSMLESPIYSGYISMICRNAPYADYSDVYEALEAGITKESLAARETGPYIQFNWSPIFSHDPHCHLQSIAPGYPRNPQIHRAIFSALSKAKLRLSQDVLYPDYSTKTLGYKSARNCEAICDKLGYGDLGEGGWSTKDLEVLYHRSGSRAEGETEIRWAWKYNDLKPRVYYARGASVYHASKYIQSIFNAFVDSLDATNRFSRYHHASLSFPSEADAFIYDYSSFTSKLETIKDFTLSIAAFCKGTKVTIVDTFRGVIRVDLGEMIEEYYEACCNFPRIDFAKLEGLPYSDDFLDNHTCGMLGVPGNISSSTLLHGIHLIIVMQTLAVKCVGDDAFAAGFILDKMDLSSVLSNIGEIELSKMDFWMHEDGEKIILDEREIDLTWQYCKRPIDRLDCSLAVGHQYVFPSIAAFGRWKDDVHTTRHERDPYQHAKKCANQLISFARQFQSEELDDEELRFLNDILTRYRRASGLYKWEDEKNKNQYYGAKLIYPTRITNQGFFEDMVESHWNTLVQIPLPESKCYEEIGLQSIGEDSFIRVRKSVAVARDMGHVTIEPLHYRFIVRDEPEIFEAFLMKQKYPSVSRVVVHESIPPWMFQLLQEDLSDSDVTWDQQEDFEMDDIELQSIML